MIAPFLVQLGQPFEFGLKIVDGFAVGFFCGWVKVDVGGRLGGVDLANESRFTFAVGFFDLLLVFGLDLFQEWILFELLLDEGH